MPVCVGVGEEQWDVGGTVGLASPSLPFFNGGVAFSPSRGLLTPYLVLARSWDQCCPKLGG